MPSSVDAAIISLKPQFADALLAGTKCVELRRRKPSLSPGTPVWFYSKVPVGKIVGRGILKSILVGSPEAIWERYAHCAGLPQDIFEAYFARLDAGVALTFSEVAALETGISLADIRVLRPNFQPPQFFQWLHRSALSDELNEARLRPSFVACDH